MTKRQASPPDLYEVLKTAFAFALLLSVLQWLIDNSDFSQLSWLSSATPRLAITFLQITAVVIIVGLFLVLSFYIWKGRLELRGARKESRFGSLLIAWGIISIVAFTFSGLILALVVTRQLGSGPIDSSAMSDAATFALFIVATLISMMALFGWQNISRHIDSRVNKISQSTKDELIGRFFSMTGHTMGQLNSRDQQFEADSPLVNASVTEFCRLGFEKLKDLSEGPRLMALNNLVYYMSLQKDASNGPWLLKQALVLREAGLNHRAARLVLTYCQVVARYSRDPDSRRLAFNLLGNIQDFQMDQQERKEAQYCQSLFQDRSLPYELKDQPNLLDR